MRKDIKISIFISVIYSILSTLLLDKTIFDFNSLNLRNYIFCKIISIFLSVFLIMKVIDIVNDKEKRKIYLVLLIPSILLFVLLFPGSWFGNDLISLYEKAQTCDFYYHLNYLTSVFYIVSYMIFHVFSSPVILTMLLSVFVFSELICRTNKIFKKKYGYYLLILAFLPHTVFYNYYPNRPIIVGLLYLYLFGNLIFDYYEKKRIDNKRILLYLGISAFLLTIRLETIVLYLTVPICITIINKLKRMECLKLFFVLLAMCLVVSLPQKIHESHLSFIEKSSRNLPTYIAPISNMINDKNFKISNEEYTILGRVLDLESMKKYNSYRDTPCVWMSKNSCIMNYNKKELEEFKKTYIKVVLNNKWLFLQSRFKTLDEAVSIREDFFTSIDLYSNSDEILYGREDTSLIFNNKIRNKSFRLIEGKTRFNIYNTINHFISSLIIPIIIIFISTFMVIKNKNLLLTVLNFSIIIQSGIVFLTAPAGYFMYYYFAYLYTWFILLLFFIEKYKSNGKSKKDKKIFI